MAMRVDLTDQNNAYVKDMPGRVNADNSDIRTSQNEQIREKDLKERDRRAEEAHKKELQKEIYGDLIGVSRNGDTATAKEESVKALEDGMVFKKSEDEKIDSLTGYTTDQLDELYNEGKIDKIKYDREIKRREELTGKEDDSKVEEDKEDVPGRVTDEKDEDDSEDTKKTIQSNEEAIQNMGRVFAREEDEQMRAQAVEEALKNGRMEIMDDIFNGSKNN